MQIAKLLRFIQIEKSGEYNKKMLTVPAEAIAWESYWRYRIAKEIDAQFGKRFSIYLNEEVRSQLVDNIIEKIGKRFDG